MRDRRLFFSKRLFRRGGFTLIELLIVVAIIAILAAIAVPNFIEAQVRAKVSRVKADMRSLATAIESYAVDTNNFPAVVLATLPANERYRFSTGFSRASLERLSTPISYMSNALLDDPFATSNPAARYIGYASARAALDTDLLIAFALSEGNTIGVPEPGTPEGDEIYARFREKGYLLVSVGPDERNYSQTSARPPNDAGFARAYCYLGDPEAGYGWDLLYDPTNGTTSVGDVIRVQSGTLN